MAEVVLSEELPDIFGGVEFRRVGRQRQERDVFRHGETFVGLVPSSAVENDDGVSARGDAFADFREMQGHGFGVDPGQHQGSPGASIRTNGAEEIGRTMPCIPGCRWPGATLCPKAGERPLLADTGFVLPPDLDGFAGGRGRQRPGYERGKVFLYVSWASGSLFG